MADIFWYYARDDQQFGPVTSVELKRLASVDELLRDDLVWREGMDEWAPALRVKGLFPPREAAPQEDEAAPLRETPGATVVMPPIAAPPVAASLASTVVLPAPPANLPPSPVEVASPPAPPVSNVPTAHAAQPTAAPPMPTNPVAANPAPETAIPATGGPADSDLTPGLRTALIAAQGILWATCVMVVILGGVLFMLTMLGAKSKADQADSAQVSATLFIGAYALARAGERSCMLLERYLSARRQ